MAAPVTDLDAALAASPPAPEAARTTAAPRRCRRHVWGECHVHDAPMYVGCVRCLRPRDEARVRRGRSSRRLGSDQERRAERAYGWEKIGERGEATDLRGRMFKVQQKSTRRAAPAVWRDAFARLDATRDGRVPLLLLSHVRQGLPTEDYVVIRGADWLDLHGRDEP